MSPASLEQDSVDQQPLDHQPRVKLFNEHETFLATLYGKALDYRSAQPILGDALADRAVRRIDFDFAKLGLPKEAAITLPIRALHLDGWTKAFLAAHPAATVLHLGCGLDCRVYRVDPAESVSWYDIDRPEVINLRRALYPARPGYRMISASVIDPRWLAAIPADKPVLVVAEGLVMYLTRQTGLDLFRRITEQFSHGEIIFDAYSRVTTRSISLISHFSSTPVNLGWGIDDPKAIARQLPRLELVEAVPFLTLPLLVSKLSRTPAQALTYKLIEKWGWMRNSMRHLRYRF